MSSALRSLAPSEAQETHADMVPGRGPPGMGAVYNVSLWSYWFADLENSAPNIYSLNKILDDKQELQKFIEAFKRTKSVKEPTQLLSDQMKETTFAAKWKRAWQCHGEILVREEMARDRIASGYKDMQLVHAELEPFMWKAFDGYHVH